MADIFLSYSRADRDRAQVVWEALEAEGFSVWWDKVLRAGQTYDEVTEGMLRDAKVVVVLWSHTSVKSKWVRAEATLGERTSAVVPAMIDDADRPIMFELVQTADLIGWEGDREDPRWKAFVGDLRNALPAGEEKMAETVPVVEAAPDANIETTFWTSVKDGTDPADFEAYLERYPDGHFAPLARNRIAALTAAAAAAASAASADPTPEPETPPEPDAEPEPHAESAPESPAPEAAAVVDAPDEPLIDAAPAEPQPEPAEAQPEPVVAAPAPEAAEATPPPAPEPEPEPEPEPTPAVATMAAAAPAPVTAPTPTPPAPAPQPTSAASAAPHPSPHPAAPEKKGLSPVVLGGAAAGVLAVIAVVAVMIMGGGQQPALNEPTTASAEPGAVDLAAAAPEPAPSPARIDPPAPSAPAAVDALASSDDAPLLDDLGETAPGEDSPGFADPSTPPPAPAGVEDLDPTRRADPLSTPAETDLAALDPLTGDPVTGTAAAPADAPPAAPIGPAVFADCEACPEMIVIPAGAFMMGSPADEPGRQPYEGPQRQVAVDGFAIARTEVTFAQWEACVAGGGCAGYEPADRGFGRGDQPALSLSFQDARNYVSWLSETTGRVYRLPTEAEWEYAARGGVAEAYWWGAAFDRSIVAAGAPVSTASLAENPFGVRGMLGNVREWVQDCYVNTFANAPADASAVTAGDCGRRVVRGGDWRDGPAKFRAANRSRMTTSVRDRGVGFRVATSRTTP